MKKRPNRTLTIAKKAFLAFAVILCASLLRGFPIIFPAAAEELAVGSKAPLFTLPNQDGTPISLESRRGAGWTVVYFYPKAETPGCTKQACAFRDAIKAITNLNATVYGISADTVEDQAGFHRHHQLTFDLLADPDGTVIKTYNARMPIIGYAKRWTFLIDPELVIRSIDTDVDPAADPQRVVEKLKKLQSESRPAS